MRCRDLRDPHRGWAVHAVDGGASGGGARARIRGSLPAPRDQIEIRLRGGALDGTRKRPDDAHPALTPAAAASSALRRRRRRPRARRAGVALFLPTWVVQSQSHKRARALSRFRFIVGLYRVVSLKNHHPVKKKIALPTHCKTR